MKKIRHSGEPGSEAIFDGINAGTSKTQKVQGDLGPYDKVSVQLDWASLTGTLDGTVALQQSNHKEPSETQWDDMGLTKTLDTADGSETLADVDFTGRSMRAIYTKNGITGGVLTAELIAK